MAAETEFGTLKAELQQLRSDISAISHTLKQIVESEGAAGYEGLRRSAERVQDRARHTVDSISSQIEERPLTSIVSAFALGMVIGVLFSRR